MYLFESSHEMEMETDGTDIDKKKNQFVKHIELVCFFHRYW